MLAIGDVPPEWAELKVLGMHENQPPQIL